MSDRFSLPAPAGFNLPHGVTLSDIDPPEACSCCGEPLGEVWRDQDQNPYCSFCAEALSAQKEWSSFTLE